MNWEEIGRKADKLFMYFLVAVVFIGWVWTTYLGVTGGL